MGTQGGHWAAHLRSLSVLAAALTLVAGALLVGQLWGGRALAADPALTSNPIPLLGTTLAQGTCPTAPMAVGGDLMVVCPGWTAVTTKAGRVQVVSLYGPGNSTIDAWTGRLPQGLAWGDKLSDIWTRLGRPEHVTSAYGAPMLIYWFNAQPYQSLELQFSAKDTLIRVNASLVH
jgi:hypothetical protein